MNDPQNSADENRNLQHSKPQRLPVKVSGAYNLCIDRLTLGNGDDKLGRILMKAFLKTLPELESPPQNIIFLNQGVFLAATDSPELATLKTLEKSGSKILICGTCLDFYNLKERLGVGEVSNMFAIATLLTGPDKVVRV